MPELPEVEVCRRNLNRWTGGRTLRDVTLLDPACIRSSASTRPSDGHPDAHAIAEAWKGHSTTSASRHGPMSSSADRVLLVQNSLRLSSSIVNPSVGETAD